MSIVNLDEDGSRIHLVLFRVLFIRMKFQRQLFKSLANLVQTGTLAHAKDFVMALVVMFRRRHEDVVVVLRGETRIARREERICK